jgi:hypothetical protein
MRLAAVAARIYSVMRGCGTALIFGVALAPGAALGQAGRSLIDDAEGRAPKAEAVRFLYPEQVTIPAGKPSTVELHFRIAPGVHINSHTPGGKYLIPTILSIPAGEGVLLEGAVYPPGAEFRPPLDPKTRLSVYAGEFTVRARLVAAAGDHLVEARLHFQACESNACMPPRTIPVAMDVIGK